MEVIPAVSNEKAFSVSWLEVRREGEENRSDDWVLLEQEEEEFLLECRKSTIEHGVPEEGELVMLRAIMPDAAYQMWANVARIEDGDRVRLAVKKRSETERIQRREHFRIAISMPISVSPINSSFISAKGQFKAKTLDISAGGIRFIAHVLIRLGGMVGLMLDLGDGRDPITCKCSVMRCRELGERRFEIGLSFADLPERQRDRIVDVLLAEMRKQLSG